MVYKSADDVQELAKQIKKNQLQSFDRLYEKYSQNLYRFARSMLKTHEDAEEVVQEVFFRVWNKRHGLTEDKSFHSYLFTIAHHVIIDQLRLRLKDQKYKQYLVKEFQKNYFHTDAALEYEELKQQVDMAINEMPAKRKHIYRLSKEKELSNKEIANREQISIKTVETHMTLALHHIRKRLGGKSISIVLFLFLFVSTESHEIFL